MKIVKLNKRHNAFKKWGFPIALRFDHWSDDARAADNYLSKVYKTASYQRPDTSWSKVRVEWYGGWGQARKCKTSNLVPRRPYWIYLRNEADVTMLVLSGVVNEDS